ncbi:MAG: hypothetical protein E7652_04595 [Ruminococcaceae bacterium]|nr:hypothetical protein [Oscillospiraceae bacterium]
MRNFKRVLSFLLVLIMLVGMIPSLGLNIAAAGVTVTLNAGPEGNGKTCTVTLDDAGTLLTDKAAIKSNYNGIAPKGTNNQRVLIGWFTGYDSTTSRGTGTEYWDTYTGESGVTLYAIWGYPIMFNANGGTYSNGESTYLGYVTNYNASGKDYKSGYEYHMPDYLGDIPTYPGCERVMYNGAYAYALLVNDGTFELWEGPNQYLTIPPTGGSAPWSNFQCVYSEKYKMNVVEFMAAWDFTVKYDANGGTGTMATDTVENAYDWHTTDMNYFENYSVKSCKFTKEGSRFIGWNTEPDGSGIAYTAGTNLGGQRDSAYPVTLYAQWGEDFSSQGIYTISFNANGGTFTDNGASWKEFLHNNDGTTYGEICGGDRTEVPDGDVESTSIPATLVVERDGYYFDGWFCEKMSNKDTWWFYDESKPFYVPQNVEFYARWIKLHSATAGGTSGSGTTTTIKFDPAGGTLISGKSSYSIKTGQTYASAIKGGYPQAVRIGYYMGWPRYEGVDSVTVAIDDDHTDSSYAWRYFSSGVNDPDDDYGDWALKWGDTSSTLSVKNGTFYAYWYKLEHTHRYFEIVNIPAVCTQAGYIQKACVCGALTESYPTVAHKYDMLWGVDTEATCLTDRIDIYKCTTCELTTTKVATGTALGHNWGEWYYAKAEDMPTCEGTGTQTADCTRPGCDAHTTQTVDPHGHDYVGTVVPAYCECEEVTLYVCQYDPTHTYTEATGNASALGHLFGEPYDNGEGYTIIECNRESDGTNPECPHEVKTANRYTIFYVLNEEAAALGANSPEYHTYGTDTTLVDASVAGFTFAGWYFDADFTQPTNGVIGAQATLAPVTLYAKWNPIEYTITVNPGNGTLTNVKTGQTLAAKAKGTFTHTYAQDSKISDYFTAAYTGYTLLSWTVSTDSSSIEDDILPGRKAAANITLTALWGYNKFPIRYYDVDAGRYITEEDTYITNLDTVLNDSMTYHASNNKTMTFPKRDGYVGTVYSDPECTTKYAAKPEQNTCTRKNYPKEEITLYLKWTVNAYALTLDDNGGTMTDASGATITKYVVSDYAYDKEFDLSDKIGDIKLNGYEFAGWNTTSGTANYGVATRRIEDFDYIPKNAVPVTAATTLYAEWKPNKFIIEYVIVHEDGTRTVLNDETAAQLNITNWATIKTQTEHTYAVNKTITTKPTRPAYTMGAWKFVDGTGLATDSANRVNDTKTYYGHALAELRDDGNYYIVLTSTCKPTTFAATYVYPYGGSYYKTGATAITTSSTSTYFTFSFTGGTDLDLNTQFTDMYRTGYTFLGWNSAAAGTGTWYSRDIDSIPGDAPITANKSKIYAVWEANTFPIEYYLDGVKLDSARAAELNVAGFDALPTIHTYNTATTCATLTRAGYTISAWADDEGTALPSKQIAKARYSYDANGEDYVIKVYATSTPATYAATYIYPYGGSYYKTGATAITTSSTSTYFTFSFTGGTDLDLNTQFTDMYRTGYTFLGWNSAAAGTGTWYSRDIDSIPGDAPITANKSKIYAVWEENTFPIEYYLDGIKLDSAKAAELGVSGFDALPDTHYYGTATTCNTLTRTGYTISAWADEAGTALASKQIAAKAYSYDVNGKDYVIKVYATSTPMKMTMSYGDSTNSNKATSAANLKLWFGEDVYNAIESVDYPGTIVFPTEANRDGYHLVGFYTDTAYTDKIESFSSVGFLTTAAATKTVYVKWEKDNTTLPTGTIDLGVGPAGISTEFVTKDKIRYGIYEKDFSNVVVTATAATFIAPTVEYFLSAKALTQAEVEALTEWTVAPNGEAFSLNGTADGEYIMYVKITDDQGNVAYISSQRFVIDTKVPVFNTLENGEYCSNDDFGSYEFTVEEKYLDKFTVNGEAVTLTDRNYTLEGSENGTSYVVYAKDKAGNTTTVTVTIYNCHDWADVTYTWAEDYSSCTAERVCKRDESHVDTADAVVTIEITKPATCEEMGDTTYTATFTVDWATAQNKTLTNIDALGHDWAEAKYDWIRDNGKIAGCIATRNCKNDADHEQSDIAKIQIEVVLEATCISMGQTKYTTVFPIDEDGNLLSDWVEIQSIVEEDIPVDPDAHAWDEGVVTAPTCTAEGYITYTCQHNAEHQKVVKNTDALGHTPEAAVKENVVDATCTEDGSYESVVYCSVCKVELSRNTEVIEALGHNEITHDAKAPTCTEIGWDAYVTCSRCDYTTYVEKAALGHTPAEAVEENRVEATCTEDGSYESVVYCSVCKVELSRNKITVDALGHTEGEAVIENNVAPTCTEKGSYDTVVYCTVCKAELSRVETIVDKLGHTWGDWTVVTPATCEGEGLEKRVCSVCQEEETNSIEAIGHKWNDGEVTAPTCTEEGYTTYTCLNDSTHTKVEDIVVSLGHITVIDEAVEPTCTETGLTEGSHCERCGYVFVEQEIVPSKGHTPVIDDAVEPTCTETGLTEGSHCEACGEILIAQEIVAAKGHTEGEAVIENNVEPTCTTDGSYDTVVYCTVCKAELSRVTTVVDALGHTPVVDKAVAPTCTETGLTEGSHCSVCDEVLVAQTVVDALGHKYDTVVTAPTCTEAGYTTYTCSVCGHTYKADELGALGHTEGEAVIENNVEPTCTTDGSYDTVVYCTVCKAELSRVTTVVDALGHKYDAVVTAPTCTEAGYTTYTCSVCGHTYKADEVEALGHTPANAVEENREEAKCDIPGSYDMVVYCEVCDAELSREHFTIEALTHTYAFEVNTEDDNGYVQCVYCDKAFNGFFPDEATGNYYYAAGEDGKTTEGLFVVEDYYYYGLTDEYGKLVCDNVYMITRAEKQVFNAENPEYALNGRNSVYAFDTEGKMIADGFVTGMHIRDNHPEEEITERTFLYNKYQLTFGLQQFVEDGKVIYRYFNEDHGHMYQNLRIWLGSTGGMEKPGESGYNPYGLPKGYYPIDANGILQMPEGYIIVNHAGNYHLTLDGVIQPQGLYEIETGKIVYVKHGLTLAQNEFIWLTTELKNGVISEPDGFYNFGDDFYMELGCFFDVYGRTYYVDEEGTLATGFINIGDDYYYFNKKSGFMYKDSTLWVGANDYGFEPGNYYFQADGKMYIADTSGYKEIVEENGKLYFVIDGVKQTYGLYELDGEYYYAQSNGVLVTDAVAWVSNVNDTGVKKAYYSFDAEGKLVKTGFVSAPNGFTYYYDNLVLAKGLTKIGDYYYFFNLSSGTMYSDTTMWVSDNDYGFDTGYYYFDAEGKLFIANAETGIKKVVYENGYYYYTIDGIKQYAGIYELDGEYYYAKTDGKLYVNTNSVWINSTNAKEFGGSSGYYAFDSEAKLVKTGFANGNGYTYYYDNLIRAKGLTKVGENYYYFNLSSGTMYVNSRLWVGGDNAYGLKSGYYYFGADGKCTGMVD